MKNAAIKEHHLYNKVYHKGKCSAGRYTVVYVLRDYAARKLMLANPQKVYCNRVGLAVSKKLGGAVVRNRVKRILRAAYRELEAEGLLRHGFLVVINARNAAVDAKSTDILRELRYAFKKTELLQKPAESPTEPAGQPSRQPSGQPSGNATP